MAQQKKFEKDFDGWNEEKKKRDMQESPLFFHEREVWWCVLGINIGFEQDGKNIEYARPVVILKTFSTNACIVVPLTSKDKKGIFYVPVGEIDGRKAVATISQIRFVDKRRLINKVAVLPKNVFKNVQTAIVKILLS